MSWAIVEDAILAAAELAELEADNYGVKTILREDQGFGFAFPIATKFKSTTGIFWLHFCFRVLPTSFKLAAATDTDFKRIE